MARKKKQERETKAHIKPNGNDKELSYDILISENGYVVKSSSGEESDEISNLRLAYFVARRGAREGDGALDQIEALHKEMKANVGSGRKRNPVTSAQRAIERLEAREKKATERLAKIQKELAEAREALESAKKEEAEREKQAEKEAKAKAEKEAKKEAEKKSEKTTSSKSRKSKKSKKAS